MGLTANDAASIVPQGNRLAALLAYDSREN